MPTKAQLQSEYDGYYLDNITNMSRGDAGVAGIDTNYAAAQANHTMVAVYGKDWRTLGTDDTPLDPNSREAKLKGFVYNPDSPLSRQQQEEIYLQIQERGVGGEGEENPSPQPLSPYSIEAINRFRSLTPVDSGAAFAGAQDPGANPYAQFITPLSAMSLAKYLSGQQSSSPYLEDFWKTNVQNPLVSQFTNETIPGLMGNYAKKGLLYGSGRELGRQKESANLEGNLIKGRSDLLYNMWNQANTNELNANNIAMSSALGATNADTSRYGVNVTKGSSIGSIEAGNRERFLQASGMINATGMAEMAENVRVNPLISGNDQYLLSLLGINQNYEKTQTVSQGNNSGQIAGQVVGAAASAAAAAASS